MLGSTIGHYRIEALLGQGGMGAVYRARDLRLDRPVALKVLTGPTGDALQQLLREARAASGLRHSAVVTIHSVEQAGDVHFIVMEYLDGRTLAEVIPAGGLPVAEAVGYGIRIADAVGAAHAAGIVHRDIKPANVMIASTGDVKVLDFGVARRSTIDQEAATRTIELGGTVAPAGSIIGTVGYLAPEQVMGQPAQPASDVFALGAVLYEMLTGKGPFARDTLWAVLDATVRVDPPAPDTQRREIPADLSRLVMRCLAKAPDQRYQSGAEVAAALRALPVMAEAAPGRVRTSRRTLIVAVAASLVAILAGGALLSRYLRERRTDASRQIVEDVIRRFEAGDAAGAYRTLSRAVARSPDDAQLHDAWKSFTNMSPVRITPEGADVAFRAYGADDEGWIPLGRTPLPAGTRVPLAQLRWRISKEGFDTLEASPNEGLSFTLVPSGSAPPGMVRVGAGSFRLESAQRDVALPDFWIDRFEVTNREFKAFIARGGYTTRAWWTQPFVKDGRVVSWDEAMQQFRDSTGRPGPSTWELGAYPDGQDDYPVSGVSWYEAAAYAASVGKALPSAYHWYKASGAFGVFSEVLRFSNFGSKATVGVGTMRGLGPYGTFDMAGNVKEWCWNEAKPGIRYILGGAFHEAPYQFRDADARNAFQREAGFGFRTMKQDMLVDRSLLDPIGAFERDPSTLAPVDDAVFAAYRRLYDYDAVPLDAKIEEEDTTPAHWVRQRVSFKAAYGGQRIAADLYVPKAGRAPYQALIFLPGAEALMLRSSNDRATQWIEFVLRSGRLVIAPIIQHTYERRIPPPLGPNVRRSLGIERGQDFRRTVDYLESRPDVDRAHIAGYGISMGAQMMPVMLAVEPRVHAGVLLSGGFETNEYPAEWDPINFAGRVRQPVLMVNGREDFDLPYDTAQVPLFKMLGTPDGLKEHHVLDGGHLPPKPVLAFKEILDWLDKTFGPTV